METIKELETKLKPRTLNMENRYEVGYFWALKDVVKLINEELRDSSMAIAIVLHKLKARIEG